MTLIVTSTSEDTISIPAWMMRALNLSEGATVKATVDGQTLNLSPIAEFLSLRGVLEDDSAFEDAIKLLNEQWQTWTTDNSV